VTTQNAMFGAPVDLTCRSWACVPNRQAADPQSSVPEIRSLSVMAMVPLMAASRTLVAAHTGRRLGQAQDQAPEESGMLTEPCRGVFTQSGRWIFI
jgi:hypothetical protein